VSKEQAMSRYLVAALAVGILMAAAPAGEPAPAGAKSVLQAKIAAMGDNTWVNLGLGHSGGHEVPAVFDQENLLLFKYGGCGDHTQRINVEGSKRPDETYGNSCWVVDMKAGAWKMIRPRDVSFPADRPGNGCSRCYAYDSKRKLVWMYGGISNGGGGGDNYDLWTYDGAKDTFKKWNAANRAQLLGDSAPGDVFVYDSANDLLVMPWGKTTRVYDPNKNAWQDRPTPDGPGAGRHYANMVFETVKNRVIYPTLGGTGRKVPAGQKLPENPKSLWWATTWQENGKEVKGVQEVVMTTWAYDAKINKWQKLDIKPEDGPSARQRFGMAYDSLNKVAILIGGSDCTWDEKEKHFNDVWAFDPAKDSWTEMKPAGTPPAVRDRECRHCAYDEKDNAVLFLTSSTGLWAYRYKQAQPSKEPQK
jgi:hypothetical protein